MVNVPGVGTGGGGLNDDDEILDPIGKVFLSRVSRSVPFSKKKDPRRGGSYNSQYSLGPRRWARAEKPRLAQMLLRSGSLAGVESMILTNNYHRIINLGE